MPPYSVSGENVNSLLGKMGVKAEGLRERATGNQQRMVRRTMRPLIFAQLDLSPYHVNLV